MIKRAAQVGYEGGGIGKISAFLLQAGNSQTKNKKTQAFT